MSKIKLTGDSSGYVEISAPSAAGNNTLELPSSGSKIVVADASDNVNVAGILTSVGGLNVGTGASVFSPAANTLVLGTNGSERLRIDSSGRVTMPYQPMFYAYQTGADYSTSTGIFASTQWNATMINVGNHFDTSNGRFTAPIAGRYVFYGKGLVRWGSSAGHVETTLYKNNSNVTSRGLGYDQMVASNDHANQFFMAYLDLAVDDWVQYGIHALSGGANLYYGENLGSFSGRLVG